MKTNLILATKNARIAVPTQNGPPDRGDGEEQVGKGQSQSSMLMVTYELGSPIPLTLLTLLTLLTSFDIDDYVWTFAVFQEIEGQFLSSKRASNCHCLFSLSR